MGLEAATKALLDAGLRSISVIICIYDRMCIGITYDDIQFASVGYCYGDSTSGQVGDSVELSCCL